MYAYSIILLNANFNLVKKKKEKQLHMNEIYSLQYSYLYYFISCILSLFLENGGLSSLMVKALFCEADGFWFESQCVLLAYRIPQRLGTGLLFGGDIER